MSLPRETLKQALTVLRVIAQPDGDARIVTDPWSALERAGLPRDAVSELMQADCLVGLGRLRFRLENDHLSATEDAHATAPAPAVPRPCVLLVVDVENVIHTHADAGIPFDPTRIRNAANRVGPVGFAFGYANFSAVPPRDLAALALAGFHCIHCERLLDGNGGKDTVDELLRDLVRRFLDHAAVEAVVLVSDDRDFASILNATRDRGTRAVVLSFRNRSSLGRIAEHRTIPLPRAPEASAAADAAPTRRWNPEDAYEDLQRLTQATSTAEREALSERIRSRAPFVARFLRAFLRKYLGGWGRRSMSFRGLMSLADTVVLPEDRDDLSQDALHAFCSAIITIGIFRKTIIEQHGEERTRYEPDWLHPFVARAVTGIPSENEGRERVRIGRIFAQERDATDEGRVRR